MGTIHPNRIYVLLHSPPYSADPMQYDSIIHHVAFGSILGNLVSQYKLGEYTPEIAKSWTSNSTQTEWVFTFRENLTYSDGSTLTPISYEQSLLRSAKIMKTKNSKSGVFEHIIGFDQLDSYSKNLPGLISTPTTLTFKLDTPMPHFLDKISFGLYAAAHQSMYESTTGKWLAEKNIVSSGPYKIVEWTNEHLLLKLRTDYPQEIVHKKPINEIDISWNKSSNLKSTFDIILGSELSELQNNNLTLQAGAPSNIFFVRILNWKNKNSVFFNKKNRLLFRNEFYKLLEKNNLKPTRSFFPLIIKGVQELVDIDSNGFEFENSNHSITIFTEKNQNTNTPIVEKIEELLSVSSNKFKLQINTLPINFQKIYSDLENNITSNDWDIVRDSTGILASEPENDIKFMFKSKEGILLPDETGEILKELEKSPLNIQRINELLWEQGLIWPVKHFASGLWARPDLDFSQINLILPPTKFQWIGWK